jgi:hypothetical protein
VAKRARKPKKQRKLTWRRIPSRVVLFVAFFIGIAGFVLAVFPFDKTDGDVTLRCGPPLYEVVVPPDAAFESPENAGCPAPARQRVIFAGVLVGAVFVIATITQIRARRLTALSQTRWLEGPRRRPTRRERRQQRAARDLDADDDRDASGAPRRRELSRSNP